MKRPQSAKAKNYWAQHSHEDSQFEQHTRSHLKYNKKFLNIVSTSNDLSRLLPKRIPHDKQRLYYETLQLKTSLNQMVEENIRLKTKIAVLERQKQKGNKLQEVGLRRGGRSGRVGGHSESQKENAVVVNLKKMVRERQQEGENLKNQLTKLKKAVRYTKINELEQEKLAIYEQNKKQAKLIIHLQTELEDRVRIEQQVDSLATQLKTRTEEVKELITENGKYQEILEQLEMRNKQLEEKLAVIQKKMHRDLAVEKRKVENLTKINEMLKNNNKKLNEKLEEEKKRPAKKVVTRPTSSNPYRAQQQSQIQKTHQSVVEKQQALQLNLKLKKQLESAKKKLAASENALYEDANSFYQTGDEPFQLVLTKNEAEQFMGSAPKTKQSKGWAKRQKINSKPQPKKEESNRKYLDELKQILTYLMKYNRYTFEQLKSDISSSPVLSFAVQDLMLMLTEQPFFLSKEYATEFIHLCQSQEKETDISGVVLINNLRKVIGQFQLVSQEQEEQMLYKIADFMTRHRNKIELEFQRFKNPKKQVTKCQIEQVLGKFNELSEEEIDLAICYVAVASQNLNEISYPDLLDKFLINNSRSIGSKEIAQEQPLEGDLSFGQNENIPCYDQEDLDQII